MFSSESLAYLRSHASSSRIALTPQLRSDIATGLNLALPADLTDVPLRWFDGDTACHEDRCQSGAFDRTYIAYVSENAAGTLFVDGADPVPIATNTGTSFPAGALHWTEGATPRLALGPMNERGEPVGFPTPDASRFNASMSSNLIAVVSNGNLYTSTDTGNTWSWDLSGLNSWVNTACSEDGSTVLATRGGTHNGVWQSDTSGATWTITDLSSSQTSWQSVVSSGNGLVLAAMTASDPSGCVWISRNSGATWSQQGTGPTTNSPLTLYPIMAMDATGNTLVVGVYDTQPHIWVAQFTSGSWTWLSGSDLDNVDDDLTSTNPITVAIDAYGLNIYIANYDEHIVALSYAGTFTKSTINTSGLYWTSIATNTGGDVIVACAYNDALYRSDNGTWTDISFGGQNQAWQNVCLSSDGTEILALTHLYEMFHYTGSTWTSIPHFAFINGANWSVVTVTGSTLVAANGNGNLYTSSDSGATWTVDFVPTGQQGYWQNVAISADGSTVLAASQDTTGTKYLWLKSGGTWSDITNGGNFIDVAMDASGHHMLAHQTGGGTLRVSYDSGGTWSDAGKKKTVAYNGSVSHPIAISADGTVAVVFESGGGGPSGSIFIGTFASSSITWSTAIQLGSGSPDTGLSTVSISADGSVIAVCSSGGTIYSITNTGSTVNTIKTGSYAWSWVSLSANGSSLLAADGAGDVWLYSSGTWTNTTASNSDIGGQGFLSATISDGTWTALTSSNVVYISNDQGATWYIPTTNAPPTPPGPTPPGPTPSTVNFPSSNMYTDYVKGLALVGSRPTRFTDGFAGYMAMRKAGAQL